MLDKRRPRKTNSKDMNKKEYREEKMEKWKLNPREFEASHPALMLR